MIACQLFILSIFIVHIGSSEPLGGATEDTLKLVHVLFRHGDRTPDGTSIYPNDPYRNETYFPVGKGQLTKRGKLREYSIGQALRQRYAKFLGPQYFPGILQAYSSETDRTKASLELVLASLFPPLHHEVFFEGLHWQPIPYTNLGLSEILWGALICAEYHSLYEEYFQSPEGQTAVQKFENLLTYVSENAGTKIGLHGIKEIYAILKCEQDWGLELPPWTVPVWPKMVSYAAGQAFYFDAATKELQTYAVGYLLQKILYDTKFKIENSGDIKKIVLYSGHDINIAYLLIALGVFDGNFPPYSSYVLLEVHEIDGEYYFKVLYQDYSYPEPHPLTIPGCGQYCSVKQFSHLVADILPLRDQKCTKPIL